MSVSLDAALRLATTLAEEGEDLSSSERIVLTRALRHQLEVAVRELGIVVRRPGAARRSGDAATTEGAGSA